MALAFASIAPSSRPVIISPSGAAGWLLTSAAAQRSPASASSASASVSARSAGFSRPDIGGSVALRMTDPGYHGPRHEHRSRVSRGGKRAHSSDSGLSGSLRPRAPGSRERASAALIASAVAPTRGTTVG